MSFHFDQKWKWLFPFDIKEMIVFSGFIPLSLSSKRGEHLFWLLQQKQKIIIALQQREN
jgi:hypothetical protein